MRSTGPPDELSDALVDDEVAPPVEVDAVFPVLPVLALLPDEDAGAGSGSGVVPDEPSAFERESPPPQAARATTQERRASLCTSSSVRELRCQPVVTTAPKVKVSWCGLVPLTRVWNVERLARS